MLSLGLYLLRNTVFILAPICEMFGVVGLEQNSYRWIPWDSKVPQTARRGHISLSYKSTWTWLRNSIS